MNEAELSCLDPQKKHLVDIFTELKANLEKFPDKTLDDSYEIILNASNNHTQQRNKLKSKISDTSLKFMFYAFSPIIAIINLVAIFEIIEIMNAVFELLANSIKIFVTLEIDKNMEEDKKNELINNTIAKYNFYNILLYNSINDRIDLNLMMIMSFLGETLLRSFGFRISTIFFLVINCIPLFLIMTFNFNDFNDKYKYSLLKILYLLLCYIILFIGVGSSTLLSHKILLNKYLVYKHHINSKNNPKDSNKSDNKENDIKNKNNNKKNLSQTYNKNINNINIIKNFENDNISQKDKTNSLLELEEVEEIEVEDGLNNVFQLKRSKTNLSSIDSKIFTFFERRKENLENILIKNKKFDYYFMICLTTILGFFFKYNLNHFIHKILENYNFYGEEDDFGAKKIFFIILTIIYIVNVLISFFLYFIFAKIFEKNEIKDEKGKKTSISICQICGYIIYSKNVNLKDIGLFAKCCQCLKLCGETFYKCCGEVICENILNKSCSPNCCKCCLYNENDYEKNKECFCYCYKKDRKYKWIYNYMTSNIQKKIIPYILEYFTLQLTTIGFEKEYEDIIEYNKIIFSILFLFSFTLFFNLTTSFGQCTNEEDNRSKMIEFHKFDEENKYLKRKSPLNEIIYNEKENESSDDTDSLDQKTIEVNEEKKIEDEEKIAELSKRIINGTHSILVFNCIFSLIFTYYRLVQKENFNKIFKENSLFNSIIDIPILMNKFYYLTLTYYCLFTSEELNILELVSGSTLISIYISGWNFIICLLKSNTPKDSNFLYIIQIVLSTSISIFIFIVCILFVIFSIKKCFFIPLILWFFAIFIGGGIWFDLKRINNLNCFKNTEMDCELCYCQKGILNCNCCCCDENSRFYSKYCENKNLKALNCCHHKLCEICGYCEICDF